MRRILLFTALIIIATTLLPCLATEVSPDGGIGLDIGYTTHDEQHPARMARQIAWRGTNDVHFTWLKDNSNLNLAVTSYQAWEADVGAFVWSPVNFNGGDDLHPPTERSLFPGIDLMRSPYGYVALISNCMDLDGMPPFDYKPVYWPDMAPLAGMFAYKDRPPSEQFDNSPCGGYDYRWPYVSFQLYDNEEAGSQDTIIHILAKENCGGGSMGGPDPGELRYFRRVGGHHPYSPGIYWDTYKIIDTISGTGFVVEPVSVSDTYDPGKVAIAWIGHWPDATGDGESATPIAYTSEKELNCNDVYVIESTDAGETWSPKYNITKNDSLTEGWAPLSDISAVIDFDSRLHIVYAARKYENTNGGSPQLPDNMNWPEFPMASRILHWSDEGEPYGNWDDNYISIVKDMNLLWSHYPAVCPGGAWSSMSLTKPMISQCDDKLYVLYSQYQDPLNGMTDNCHIDRYNGSYYNGAANATLHLAVSSMSNGGFNWDPSRMLTDFTPRCDTGSTADPNDPVDPDAITVCHNHGWPTMARYGMYQSPTSDFTNAIVVNDPSWSQSQSPNYYLDVLYIDDLYPGNFIQNEGTWSLNPVKWFRVPCVDEETAPQLSPNQIEIYEPDYEGNPGEEIIYPVVITNIGNVPTDIIITTEEIDNVDPAIDGWLYVDLNGFGGTLSHMPPDNTHEFLVIVNHNGIVDDPWVPTTLQGNVIFQTPSRQILYELGVEHLIPGSEYVCGDVDGVEGISILDVVYIINYKYKEGPVPLCTPILSCADVDNNGEVTILDVVYIINFKYKEGPEPNCP